MTTSSQDLSSVKQALLEKLHQELVPQLEQLVQELPEQLVDFSQAEMRIREGLLKIARPLLDHWSAVADAKITRPQCAQCNVPMRHRGLAETGLATTVGDVRYRRPRWRCESCGTESYPHDAVLRFFAHNVSWPLARLCARLAAQIPSFDEARGNVAEDYGVHLATETLRRLAEEAGDRVLKQEDAIRQRVMERQEPLPESDEKPAKAYVFADGTTVHSAGDWHEIRVMTAVTENAAGELLQRRSQARFFGVEEVGWTLVLLARSLGYANASQRAFIADGAAWLWKLQETYFGGAVAILDWYHLAEKVHKVTNAVFGIGSADAASWSGRLKESLWEGRVTEALAWTREEYAKARSPSKREAWHELLTYLENNQQHMRYPDYRAAGLPIGSGQVEAQCKTLVGGRCKQGGMRNWTYPGAEGILRMRTARQDGSFDDLWNTKLRVAA